MPEDVHVAKKIECVSCHETGPGGMGHIDRMATCQDCHIEIEQAMAVSVHKNLVCAACHVKVLGGYEMTSWGPGEILSKPNPFKKYSLYYGPQEPPILIKDQSGRWMPTKIWPNSAGGIKEVIEPKPGLTFRWPKGETHDAFALLGTFRVPRGNNNYLAWLQVEEVAHPYGKSRSCGSCHDSETQIARVTWKYYDTQGAEPFTGSQKVIADKSGLQIRDIKATSKIVPLPDGKLTSFAAWLLLGDIWKTQGDFSIPKSNPAKYHRFSIDLQSVQARLKAIDRILKKKESRGDDVKMLRRRWKEAKAVALHEPGSAGKLLDELSSLVQ